jgi:hypothetical protein
LKSSWYICYQLVLLSLWSLPKYILLSPPPDGGWFVINPSPPLAVPFHSKCNPVDKIDLEVLPGIVG